MEVPYSLSGRVIRGRSIPRYDKRIRGQPYDPEAQLPMNHTMAPGYGQPLTEEERRQKHYARFGSTNLPPRGSGNPGGRAGQPLTEEQRAARHYARFGSTDLPPRGTGRGVSYGAGVQQMGFDWGSFFLGGVLAFIFGYFVLTASGRRIGYAAGRRLERRVR